MKIKIQYRKWTQYTLIYLMLVINQSQLFESFLKNYDVFILSLLLAPIVLNKKFRNQHTLLFLGFLLLCCAFTHFFVGGVGIDMWVRWALQILIVSVAILYDKTNFLTRYVKIVVFLAAISLLGFFMCLVAPEIVKELSLIRYSVLDQKTWISGTKYISSPFYTYGLFLFTARENGWTRNCGIFTEPGVYQIVLNTALFVILFCSDKIQLKDKYKTRAILIIIAALITCQSTTGYIALLTIIITVVLGGNNKSKRVWKKQLFVICIGLMIVLLIDYSLRGNESFAYTTMISKFFNSAPESSSRIGLGITGKVRYGAILLSLKSLLSNPFGVGYDQIALLLNVSKTGYVAAQILQTAAAMGIVCISGILYWIFYPSFITNKSRLEKLLFVFLYFNTSLAQSSEFYPALIMIPLYWLYTFKVIKTNKYSEIRMKRNDLQN